MAGRILVAEYDGVHIIKFEGDVRLTLCVTVDGYLDRMFADDAFRGVVVDLNDTIGIDSTSLGILAKLSIQAEKRFGFVPTLVCTNPDITRILLSMGFWDVFDIIEPPLENASQLRELPSIKHVSEDELRRHVIEAHRVLMGMNESNREAFKDLVAALEADEESNASGLIRKSA
jgi:anti-anti-sigma factor|tara:strand:- start:3145 stop:3666 length:522 start_codon:yes stop_codon:yes gene_type:complete